MAVRAGLFRRMERLVQFNVAAVVDALARTCEGPTANELRITGYASRAAALVDAVARFETALRLRPTMIETHLNYVRALLLAGRATDARTHALAIVQRVPNSADGYFLLGNALALLGDLPGATAAYEGALALSPGAPEVLENLTKVRTLLESQRTGTAPTR